MRKGKTSALLVLSFLFICSYQSFGQCVVQGPPGPVCASESVRLRVTSPAGGNFQWDFDGDGKFDETGASVDYRFPAPAVDTAYTVRLYRDSVLCQTTSVTIRATPDPSIGVPLDGGAVLDDQVIRVCSGVPSVNISFFNNSRTLATNQSYAIDWGDGSPVLELDNTTFNNSTLIKHTFEGFGFHTFKVTARGAGTCAANTLVYRVYIGSNPSVGLGNPGNTVGLCAPVTLTFPITGTQNNPAGTEYNIYVNGQRVASYNQTNLPPFYTHTFRESSCGQTTSTRNYQNAFDLQIIASNPCGSSTATVEPIEISEPPVAKFTLKDSATCTGQRVVLENTSVLREIVSGNPSRCVAQQAATWAITPGTSGVDWVIADGNLFNSNRLGIDFKKPGVYTVTITVNSPSCGKQSYTQQLTVKEAPRDVRASVSFDTQSGCAPGTVRFLSEAKGENLKYEWSVSPARGWRFIQGNTLRSANPALEIREGGEYKFRLRVRNDCTTLQWDTTLVFKGPPKVELPGVPDACQSTVLNFDETLVRYKDLGSPITRYYWEFSGSPTSSSWEAYPQGVRFNTTGSYPYRVAVTNACGTTTVSDTLRVVDPAPVKMPDVRRICLRGDAVKLEANPRGGIWSGPGVTADGLFRPSEAGPGKHTLQYRFGVGQCNADGSMEMEVMPGPVVDAGPNLRGCVGGSPVELNGTPAGGKWSDADGFVSGNQFDAARAGEGSFRIYYQFTDAMGCAGLDSLSLKVFPPPAVDVGDIVVCDQGGAVTLPTGEPAGGAWSGPGVANNTFDPVQAGGSGVYDLKYTFSDGNGCAGTAISKATVVGADMVKAGPDLTICAGDAPVDLAPGASPAGGRWVATGGGLDGTRFDPAKVLPGEHEVIYEVGIGNCNLQDKRIIRVVPIPAVDLSKVPTFICEKNRIELIASPAGGAWSGGPGAVVSGNYFDPAASGTGIFRLNYSYVATGGCRAQGSIEVSVGDPPPIRVRDTIYCDGPARMILPKASPGGGTWSGPGVEGETFSPQRAGGIGNYQLFYTYINAGCSASASAKIQVLAATAVEAGAPDTACLGSGPIQLKGFSPIGGRWSGKGITDERTGLFDPAAAGVGQHALVYSVGSTICVTKDTVKIRVFDLPEVEPGPPIALCSSDPPVSIGTGKPLGGTWSGPGFSQGRFDPATVQAGVHQLVYTVTDPVSGCVAKAERPVTVHARPLSLFPTPAATCAGDTIQFVNDSRGATNYRWDFGDGETSALSRPRYAFPEGGEYTIRLISTNDFGCSDTLARQLKLAGRPKAAFSLDNDKGCTPLKVTPTSTSTGGELLLRWDFGNGRQVQGPNPGTVSYTAGRADTAYVITLTAENKCAANVFRDTVRVWPLPKVDFGTAIDTSCSPAKVEFVNRSTGRMDFYSWDFGNGQISADSLPKAQAYEADTSGSTYTIRLIAGNRCGRDTLSRNITVRPARVRAFFNVPSREGCVPFQVSFTNFSTIGAMVRWDFGDGEGSTAENPVHVFKEAGEYVVWQYASNGCASDSIRQVIRVLPAPVVDFIPPAAACLGEELRFENRSRGAIGYFWSFGDGDSSRAVSPVHRFTEPGAYTVWLRAISATNRCEARDSAQVRVYAKPTAEFTPSRTNGCQPLRVDFSSRVSGGAYFQWDFGDGNTAVTEQPSHLFQNAGNFQVRLTVSDPNGCAADTVLANILVHPKPKVDFEIEEEAYCGLPAPVMVFNQSTGASGFRWDFGDGNTSSFNNPGEHLYREGGLFTIRLIGTNNFQCVDTAEKKVEIFPPPAARYEIDNRRGCGPLEVKFANFSSANHYYWDFGDGNGSNLATPVHEYKQPGRYDIRLVVSYNDLCFDTLLLRGAVEVFPSPIADFDFREVASAPAGTIDMINYSQNATAWRWDFSDGKFSDEENPRHRFLFNGKRKIRLEASNVYGCVDDTVRIIEPPFIKGLFVPNAFSPENGLGEVRLFVPKGVGLKEYHIQVFSPYGQLVWESEKLADGQPAESWDGTLNGRLLPQDVYVWKASGVFEDGTAWKGMPDGSGNFKTIGSVTLLR